MRKIRCHLCEGMLSVDQFPAWDRSRWACGRCWTLYMRFRRAFRAEWGRYPTIAEFRDDGA